VPRHDPLRMTGQVAVLDMLCTGRLRFDAASSMMVNALRDGFMEGEGRCYKQPTIAIRPRPQLRRAHLCRSLVSPLMRFVCPAYARSDTLLQRLP